MPDEIKPIPDVEKAPAADTVAAGESAETAKKADENATPDSAPPISLADDLAQLEKLNLMRAVMLRLQGGRHPNAQVDALLKRRFDFKTEDFQGPYAIRLICTLMMIFLICMILWGIVWLVSTAMELNSFIQMMSMAMATLMAAGAGVAIFHPASVPDEKLLKEAIAHRMAELKDLGASLQFEQEEANAKTAKSSATENLNEGETAGSENDLTDEADRQLDAVAPETIEPNVDQ